MARAWRIIFLGAGLILGGAAGCASMPSAARRDLLQARREYDAGDPAGAEQIAARIIARHPDKVEIAEVFYLRGLARVRQGRPGGAKSDFRDALSRSKRKALTARSAEALGMVLQKEGTFDKAADSYGEALAVGDASNEPLDELLYNLGVCLQRCGRWEGAREVFGQLLREYPSGRYVRGARSRFEWPHKFFSIQCGVFANPSNAQKLLADFSKRGFRAFIQPRGGLPDGTHPVYVGRYSDYKSARRALPRVKRVVVDAYVVP